jgi:transposase
LRPDWFTKQVQDTPHPTTYTTKTHLTSIDYSTLQEIQEETKPTKEENRKGRVEANGSKSEK